MSKKLFGCPIKPAKQACPLRWSLRSAAAQGPQKLWGEWCKILHSGHILAHKSRLQIVGFFYWIFCLTSHKAPRSSGLKGAKICNLAISWHINQLVLLLAIFFRFFCLRLLRPAPVTNFHMFEKRKLIKYK